MQIKQRKIKSWFIFIVVFCAPIMMIAEGIDPAAVSLIESAMDNMTSKYTLEKGSYLTLEMKIETKTSSRFESPEPSVCSVFSGEGLSYYFSDDLLILQDKEVSVSVMTSEKLVYINDAPLVEDKSFMLSKFTGMQKDMLGSLEGAQIVESPNGANVVKVVLSLSEKIRASQKVNKVIYEIDTYTNEIVGSVVYYEASHPSYVTIDIEYTKAIKSSNKPTELSKSAMEYVFKEKELLAKYQDFQVIDTRIK